MVGASALRRFGGRRFAASALQRFSALRRFGASPLLGASALPCLPTNHDAADCAACGLAALPLPDLGRRAGLGPF